MEDAPAARRRGSIGSVRIDRDSGARARRRETRHDIDVVDGDQAKRSVGGPRHRIVHTDVAVSGFGAAAALQCDRGVRKFGRESGSTDIAAAGRHGKILRIHQPAAVKPAVRSGRHPRPVRDLDATLLAALPLKFLELPARLESFKSSVDATSPPTLIWAPLPKTIPFGLMRNIWAMSGFPRDLPRVQPSGQLRIVVGLC